MTDDRIASLYRKPCPSCAHDLPRDAHQCEFCGYTEATEEEDQERLYVEYLSARLRQVQVTIVELVEESRQSVLDPARAHQLREAKTEAQTLELELAAYRERSPAVPPPTPTPEPAEVDQAPARPVAAPEHEGSIRPVEAARRTTDAVVHEAPRRSGGAAHRASSDKPVTAQRVMLSEGVASDRRLPKGAARPVAAAPVEKPAPVRPAAAAPVEKPAPVRPAAAAPVEKPAPVRLGAAIPSVHRMAEKTLWADDKRICPACGTTADASAAQCACGQALEAREAPGTTVCPHCTATVLATQSHCSCGYPLSLSPQLPGLGGGEAPTIPSINSRKNR